MSINILHRGRNASVLSLADACFEKQIIDLFWSFIVNF